MIKMFVCLMLFIICFSFYQLGKKVSYGDVFSPLCFYNVYFFLTRFLRVMICDKNIYTLEKITDEDLLLYLLFTSIFHITVCLTLYYSQKSFHPENKEYYPYRYPRLWRIGVVSLIIGVASKVYLIQKAGGLFVIWNNLWKRTQFLAGSGYMDYLGLFLTIAVACFEICYLHNTKILKYRVSFVLSFVIASGLNLAFGARAPFMKLVIAVVFVYAYTNLKGFRIKDFLKPKALIVGVVGLGVLLILPALRSTNFNTNQLSFEFVIGMLRDRSSSLINELSLVDEDIFTFSYFTKHDHWLGANYLNLITAWIPRGFFASKPPVDDGMLLKALMLGIEMPPNAPLTEFYNLGLSSSVPFTSNGIFFANFGFLGCILGGLLTGKVLAKGYNQMCLNGYTVESILMYQFFCTRLCFSVKGIVELMMMYIILFCIFKFMNRLTIKTARR